MNENATPMIVSYYVATGRSMICSSIYLITLSKETFNSATIFPSSRGE
jgi:hypothetical protein